jgi:DNA-binding MarR family transcriptional regulator
MTVSRRRPGVDRQNGIRLSIAEEALVGGGDRDAGDAFDERRRHSEVFGLLTQGYQRLVTAINRDLKTDADITLPALTALIHVADAPDHQIRPSDLAQKCAISPSGCTRLLDRLEERSLVERSPHDTDRRYVVVQLTSSGRRTLDSALPTYHASLDRHLGNAVNGSDLTRLGATMGNIAAANPHNS